MTEDPRAEWRKALADRAKAARGRRGKHRKTTTVKPGMIRRPPPPKETA